jgi:glycosyltransferase involved in cell wall biosynthesis
MAQRQARTFSEAGLEVVVMDDSQYRIRYPPSVVVDWHPGKRGAVKCLNLGISKASNDIVVPIGEDTYIPDVEAFMRRLSGYFELPWVKVVGFNVVDAYNHIRPGRIASLAVWLLFGQSYPERGSRMKYGDGISVTCFALDRSRLAKRFDEGFLGSGFSADFDFCYQEKVLYAPELKVWHSVPDTPYHTVVRANRRLMVHNRGWFLRKHFRFWRLRLVMYVGYLLLMPVGEGFYRRRRRSSSTRAPAVSVLRPIPAS